MAEFPSTNDINEALDKIFSLPEFSSPVNEMLARFLDWLDGIFNRVYNGEFDIVPIAMIVLFFLLIILGTIILTRSLSRYRALESYPNVESVDDPWHACMEYAEREIYEKAIVFLFIWYLSSLASSGFITIEKGKTNYQYELELTRNAYGKLERFRAFKVIFAATRYGGRGVSRDDFESWRLFCLETIPKGDAA